MHTIITADRQLFGYINDHFHNNFFDLLMPFVRNSITWMPLYIFLLFFILLNFTKDKWQWIALTACTVILTNFISSNLIKDHIMRLRPCNDPAFADRIRFLLSYRPQSSSFTSSHAVNHFAMATFFFFTLKKYIGNAAWLFIFWAALICYAQVYIGVHFPLDVTCGAILGIVFGYLSARLYNRYFSLM